MRKFSSYGPINTKLHYYAPRKDLINQAFTQLLGENPDEGGHYITVWAPRQTGKTWVMQQIVKRLQASDEFETAILTMQSAKEETTTEGVLEILVENLSEWFNREFPTVDSWKELSKLFTSPYFTKPLILILDEFDAIEEAFINKFANEFRSMYTKRLNELHKQSGEKSCLLHGLALIGVRTVLGIENVTGSPFNVQRSLHIPNLTFEEVDGMFKWYEQESGQQIEQDVINRLYYETQGQPGLTCWLGELLTETYNEEPDKALTMKQFNYMFMWATQGLPNNNILNIISKAKQEPYKDVVLELFKTHNKFEFTYDDVHLNFLYMNGVIDIEHTLQQLYAKFPSPFVQKRLFNAFSREIFPYLGKLHEPFEALDDIITEEHLNICNLLKRYERYLQENRDWLLKDAPKRADLRIYEAVYHFNLYMYLHQFLRSRKGDVYPEFPTGNGKIELIIKYKNTVYGLEVKSFSNDTEYREALTQAARYGKELNLAEIALVCFVEYIDEENRNKYETAYVDETAGVTVTPVFVTTGR
jgi:hypothetical protein